MRKRYEIQSHYQNNEWLYLPDTFEFCGDAICFASELADFGFPWGIVRVVDWKEKRIVITYAAGGGVCKE